MLIDGVPLHVMALLGFELMTAGITGSIAIRVTQNSGLPAGGSVGVLQRFGPFYLFMLSLFAIVNMWGLGFFATSVPNNTHALYYAEPLGINALLEAAIWLFLGGAGAPDHRPRHHIHHQPHHHHAREIGRAHV